MLKSKVSILIICGSLLVQTASIADNLPAQVSEDGVRVPKGCRPLIASWYSIASLKKEDTWKKSKGVMANGEKFRDDNFTCASRLYPLGSWLKITSLFCSEKNGKRIYWVSNSSKSIVVIVTDRISKRFAEKRIDLTPVAFSKLAKLEDGVVAVKVERIK